MSDEVKAVRELLDTCKKEREKLADTLAAAALKYKGETETNAALRLAKDNMVKANRALVAENERLHSQVEHLRAEVKDRDDRITEILLDLNGAG